MKQKLRLANIDCIVCANKIESALLKIDSIDEARVSLMTEKITIFSDEEVDKLFPIIKNTILDIEPKAVIDLL